MTDANEWQGRTGDSWAAQWRRTDRSFISLTEHLLRRSSEYSFRSVLDIGCGAGELSFALARQNASAKVTGVDISPPLIATARERGSHHAHVFFELADAASWQPAPGGEPDFLISRHGVMFFDKPEAAFTHLAEIAEPGAALLFSCFRDLAENPIFTEVARLVSHAEPPGDPLAPGPFAFADRARVERILTSAGWRAITFQPLDFAMIIGAGEDPIEDSVHYFSAIGPAARAASEMAPDERERFFERVRELARRNLYDRIVSMRAAAWIVTARKA